METGDKFNYSFGVTEKVYTGFIDLFNDNNPLHTQNDFAIAKGFEGKVMHGNILNGFISYFIGECLPNKDVIIHSQQIKYSRPVYLNDVLNFEAEITNFFESVKAYEFKFHFCNKANEKVAKGQIQIGII